MGQGHIDQKIQCFGANLYPVVCLPRQPHSFGLEPRDPVESQIRPRSDLHALSIDPRRDLSEGESTRSRKQSSATTERGQHQRHCGSPRDHRYLLDLWPPRDLSPSQTLCRLYK